jgi:CheY-like chemotaxis protein
MPKTLLLADDSVTIQKVVGISFANEDVRIVTVDNGDDAVARAKEIRPDIVLADVVMPGKSGYDVCAALKADPALAGVPVLLLTGTFETFDEERAARVGADGHITKPFEAQALVALVSSRLASGAAARPAVTGKAAAPAAEPEPFDFLEPEPAPVRRPSPKGGTARPVASLSRDGFAFDAEPLEEIQLETEDDVDLGNEATAARTTLLLDEDEGDAFAVAETVPPVEPAAPAPAAAFDDENEVTRLVMDEAPAAPVEPEALADAGDPLAGLESVAADPFTTTAGRAAEWDVSADEVIDSFATRVLGRPAPEASPAPAAAAAPVFTEPLFDEDEAAAEFDLAAESPPPAPAAAAAPAAAPLAAAPELSGALRDQLHETLEKIAWEALGDLSERIVREAVARIEQVAWDVFPRLAETLIREEIRRLKGEE